MAPTTAPTMSEVLLELPEAAASDELPGTAAVPVCSIVRVTVIKSPSPLRAAPVELVRISLCCSDANAVPLTRTTSGSAYHGPRSGPASSSTALCLR